MTEYKKENFSPNKMELFTFCKYKR